MNPNYNQQQGIYDSPQYRASVAQASPDVRLNFIRKTYLLFMAGILASLVMGAITLTVPAVLSAALTVLDSRFLAIALIFGGSIAAQAVSRKEGLNYVALFAFTALLGFMFAPIVAMFEMSSPGIVGQAAFLTITIFGSLTAYVFVTRKDFSFMGGLLFVGLIALIIGGLANMFFFKSGGLSYWMAWVTAFLFSGYVLYDTSNIIRRYDEKAYCSAALALFLDFFNLFMALLRILGGSRR